MNNPTGTAEVIPEHVQYRRVIDTDAPRFTSAHEPDTSPEYIIFPEHQRSDSTTTMIAEPPTTELFSPSIPITESTPTFPPTSVFSPTPSSTSTSLDPEEQEGVEGVLPDELQSKVLDELLSKRIRKRNPR
jgi:hypothetical protein